MNVYVIDDGDYFVAANLDDLWTRWKDFHGATYEDMVGEPRTGAYVYELPPKTRVTVDLDDGMGPKTLMAAEWAKGGAGFLCSANL